MDSEALRILEEQNKIQHWKEIQASIARKLERRNTISLSGAIKRNGHELSATYVLSRVRESSKENPRVQEALYRIEQIVDGHLEVSFDLPENSRLVEKKLSPNHLDQGLEALEKLREHLLIFREKSEARVKTQSFIQRFTQPFKKK